MVQNPPANMPRITPYLYYEDVASALDWLTKTYGFSERLRMPGPDGGIMHAEMEFADGVIMMGCPSPDFKGPKHTGQVNHSLYVYVDDVDAHYEHARRAGATVLSEPEDQFYGDRMYRVEDFEGNHWGFAQHIKDIAPEDMKLPE